MSLPYGDAMSDQNTDTQRAGFGWTGHAAAPVSPYFTAIEAAMYLRTTVQGIYSLVKRGRLKPMPGSGRLLFTRDALDRYLTTRHRT
jgi:excisionase family DNA binding protein